MLPIRFLERQFQQTVDAWRTGVLCCALFGIVLLPGRTATAEVTSAQVLKSIERAKHFLVDAQRAADSESGFWQTAEASDAHRAGVTSLALLALINSGMTADDAPVRRGLSFLRKINEPDNTYDASLMIMALAAAHEHHRDGPRLASLVRRLEVSQIVNGPSTGSWGYAATPGAGHGGRGDHSNSQYAVLALREAQDIGVNVSPIIWKRTHEHWKRTQNSDGGWTYEGHPGEKSTGSMTVAGITTMIIAEDMLTAGQHDVKINGMPQCCGTEPSHKEIEGGVNWMGRHFSVTRNPEGSIWRLYYLYGLERAGRLSGVRFFGTGLQKQDWYRAGAEDLVARQTTAAGSFLGDGSTEADPVVGTSFALLFLSKGLAPVLINKLEYSTREAGRASKLERSWNRHPRDVRNLTQLISTLPKWPRLLISQCVSVSDATVEDLLQAPLLYIGGDAAPSFTPEQVGLLKEYIVQGGMIYAEKSCNGEEFDRAFRELVAQMYPQGESKLIRLSADHPIYRSEYLLDPSTVELWGVEVGCRTCIIYSPHDLSCLWDKWWPFEIRGRTPQLTAMITKAIQVGVNVVAYATGREPANKLNHPVAGAVSPEQDKIERGFLQIAKLRHTGGWDAAPQALKNLLLALNKTAGMSASTKVRDLTALDPNIYKYPMLYLHGRHEFELTTAEQEKLREYLTRHGVVFADACCGSPQFDQAFRKLMQQVFPSRPLKRVPVGHSMFTSAIGYDLKQVKRRELDPKNAVLRLTENIGEPFLEGIEIDGRYVVIYSKYDISCALERQASVSCAGYVHEDALRIAMNVVLYALLQ